MSWLGWDTAVASGPCSTARLRGTAGWRSSSGTTLKQPCCPDRALPLPNPQKEENSESLNTISLARSRAEVKLRLNPALLWVSQLWPRCCCCLLHVPT